MTDGWLVLQAVDRQEPQTLSFEDCRDRILARMRPPRYRTARQAEQLEIGARLRTPSEESPEAYGPPLFEAVEPAWSEFWGGNGTD
jgi:hypothetical protein